MNRKYTDEHIEFIAKNIPGRPFTELTGIFNNRFGMALKVSAMIALAARHGLHNGRNTRFDNWLAPAGVKYRFPKGHVPANKGKKGISYPGMKATQFKKGHKPWNYKPVGTERINTDGYVDVKIADPNKWKAKHVLIWEEANGPVPRGYVLIFADGNKLNVALDNLLLVSRKQLAIINKCGLISGDAELTKAGVVVADVLLKIGERKRKDRGKDERRNRKKRGAVDGCQKAIRRR